MSKGKNVVEKRLFKDPTISRKKGPPNRMNDLSYTDWMKFQKSFFRFTSTQKLIEDCIYFFTKSVWEDGNPSSSLVVGSDDFNANAIPAPRIIHEHSNLSEINEVASTLSQISHEDKRYDFALVDLRPYIKDPGTLSYFLDNYSAKVFGALKRIVTPDRYCAVLVSTKSTSGAGFPLPWAVADSSRLWLKLRDEKVGIMEDDGEVLYCIFMQNQKDSRIPTSIDPDKIHIARINKEIPSWVIPKPPPRKKNEILHPAKFPETLIKQFIELFTKPGDNVFDPMVGTGSTVVAAIQSNRHGYGIDLINEFVEIAKKRAQYEVSPGMFPEFQKSVIFNIVQGDATRLDELAEFSDSRFDYVVTSPPYWSVLTNQGSEGQRARRIKGLPLTYSEDEKDLGNVQDYDSFLASVEHVYNLVAKKLRKEGYLTVIVKNLKRQHTVFPLAWDITARLCGQNGKYEYLGTTLWCQDDISIKPFAVGIHWVSNVLHQYCLHFKKRY
jgi:DNA modification methylase